MGVRTELPGRAVSEAVGDSVLAFFRGYSGIDTTRSNIGPSS